MYLSGIFRPVSFPILWIWWATSWHSNASNKCTNMISFSKMVVTTPTMIGESEWRSAADTRSTDHSSWKCYQNLRICGRTPSTDRDIKTLNWSYLWQCTTYIQCTLTSRANRQTARRRRNRPDVESRHHWTGLNRVIEPFIFALQKDRLLCYCVYYWKKQRCNRQRFFFFPEWTSSLTRWWKRAFSQP